MRTYAISPDLFKRSNFNDEYEDWMLGCLKSKWDNSSSNSIDDFEESESEIELQQEVFNPNKHD